MYHYNSTRAMVHRFIKRRKIDLPTAIVNQWVGCNFHILQVRQKLEEGIARLRN